MSNKDKRHQGNPSFPIEEEMTESIDNTSEVSNVESSPEIEDSKQESGVNNSKNYILFYKHIANLCIKITDKSTGVVKFHDFTPNSKMLCNDNYIVSVFGKVEHKMIKKPRILIDGEIVEEDVFVSKPIEEQKTLREYVTTIYPKHFEILSEEEAEIKSLF